MTGYIKLHRKILDWGWYNKSEMVHLFIHLILSANIEDKPWGNMIIKRGQLATGLNSLSEKTGISIRTLRTCLGRLKSTSELTIKTTNKFSIITICKYEDYNPIENKNDKQIDKQSDIQSTTTKEYNNNTNSKILMSEIKISDFTVGSKELEYFKIANAFIEVFKKNKSLVGDSNLKDLENAKYKAYTDPIRLCIERDGYKVEDMRTVIKYLKSDQSSFWKPNILSTSKLREKFSKLIIAANGKSNLEIEEMEQETATSYDVYNPH